MSSPTIICFQKIQLFYKLVIYQKVVEKDWDMHKSEFQGLKRMFMHVSNLPPPYFDLKKKQIDKVIGFCYQNMLEKDLRHE